MTCTVVWTGGLAASLAVFQLDGWSWDWLLVSDISSFNYSFCWHFNVVRVCVLIILSLYFIIISLDCEGWSLHILFYYIGICFLFTAHWVCFIVENNLTFQLISLDWSTCLVDTAVCRWGQHVETSSVGKPRVSCPEAGLLPVFRLRCSDSRYTSERCLLRVTAHTPVFFLPSSWTSYRHAGYTRRSYDCFV